ncbi:DUF2325 domain-containing protein [Desulfosediminicola sp.]|uniref:DUF2325 domain-containing protein n=1 Tax=Desulfosediminicola sp. TaxID=2886825 RepID=UPI003AF28B2A
MKGDIELVEESKSCNGRSVRKKLWQLEQRYHCSLIGICLSRNDLRAFSQRKSYGISSKANDFEIHQHLTGIASLRSTQSRVLHKMLDHKYSQAVRRYSSCSDDEAIRAQWEEDQRAGRVAGAYWAIMTSGVCSSRLLDRVYGDSHMISFETFSSQLQRNRKVQDLRSKLLKMKEQAALKQRVFADESKLREETAVQLQLERSEMEALKREMSDLAAVNSLLQKEISQNVPQALTKLRNELERLKSQNDDLKAENAQILGECKGLEQQADKSEKEAGDQLKNLKELTLENHSLKAELATIEAMLRSDGTAVSPCDDCGDFSAGQCIGPDLCGKTILYVGGRHNMICHYREMVENRGGNFLHHDGGRENSRQLLPKMLNGADAVLCPVDCISHDACSRVKKECKKYQKKFVIMRSSGLSSLARGLGMIQV